MENKKLTVGVNKCLNLLFNYAHRPNSHGKSSEETKVNTHAFGVF